MQSRIDSNAPKKATNLSVNIELLDAARTLNINLSATLEQALTEKVRQERRKQWLQNNKATLNTCNELAEQNGLFADKHRMF